MARKLKITENEKYTGVFLIRGFLDNSFWREKYGENARMGKRGAGHCTI